MSSSSIAHAAGAASPFAGEAATPASPPPPPAPPPAGSASGTALPLPSPPPAAASAPPPAAPAFSAPGTAALPPGAPGSDLPAPPRQARGAYLHDGFYLRVGAGLAYAGALVSSDSKNISDYSFGGPGVALDVWLGGSPTPGLALGAVLSAIGMNSSKRRVSDQSISGDVSGSTGLLGFFTDVFPDPERGFHFGGALGIASGQAEVKGSSKTYKGGGIGLEAWTGYDFWVSQQWSLGAAVRFMGSATQQDSEAIKYQSSMGGMSLSFTALYH